MCQVKALNEMNYINRDIAERYDAKEYRITMTLKAAQGRSSRELLGILARLSQLDQNIKKGKADPVLGLEMFIIEVTRR
jgi:DNA polymerase III delta subunit